MTNHKATLAVITTLLATQPACVTSALLKLGADNPAKLRTEQPVAYIGAARQGASIELQYDATLDAEGETHARPGNTTRVNLGSVYWRNLGATPIDPYCTREMWNRLLPDAPPQPPAPLITGRPSDHRAIAGLHKQYATGFPLMTVQVAGLDAWVVCGAGDAIGVAEAPYPPPPQAETSGGPNTGQTVAIVLLFPFALAVDTLAAVFYVAACLSGASCR